MKNFDDLYNDFFKNYKKVNREINKLQLIVFEPGNKKLLTEEEIDIEIEKAILVEDYEKAAFLRDEKQKLKRKK
jgi:hypothetical protein